MKTLKPGGKFIILHGITETSKIIVDKDDNNKPLESLTVYAVGEEVEKYKAGDDVMVSRLMLQDAGRLIVAEKDEKNKPVLKEGEFHMAVYEDNIIGKYE